MRKFEVILSSFTAVASITLSLYLANWIASYQSIWPFPALYLIELCLLALVAWFFSYRDFAYASAVIWAIAGAFLAFFFLAGFSIGLYYLPSALFFGVVALLSDLRRKDKTRLHLEMLVLGVILQGGIILLVLRFVLKP